MARHYARTCHEDYEDLLGEAWFAVFDALEIADLNIGDPYQFLLKRARWRMLDYIKWARRRRCEDLETAAVPTEVTADVAPGVVGNTLLEQISQGLTTTQQAVLQGLLQGETWREVAGSLGCSSANVAYHVRQIRQRAERLVEWALRA
jgi:DNA-directed RNA polymerase specialized sigma24 family protein